MSHVPQDDLYAILPAFNILELVIILIYLGHISGCFFYLLSTPPWQTPGGFLWWNSTVDGRPSCSDCTRQLHGATTHGRLLCPGLSLACHDQT